MNNTKLTNETKKELSNVEMRKLIRNAKIEMEKTSKLMAVVKKDIDLAKKAIDKMETVVQEYDLKEIDNHTTSMDEIIGELDTLIIVSERSNN